MQQHRQLPRLHQHHPALRVLRGATRRRQHRFQACCGLVVAPLVQVRHRSPVVAARLQRRPLTRHQVEQPLRLAQLLGARRRVQQQPADALDAKLEIHLSQCLGIVGHLVEVHVAVDAKHLLASHLVTWVELQRPVQRRQRLPPVARVGVADAAQHVLEDAQPRHDPPGVDEVQQQRRPQRDALRTAGGRAAGRHRRQPVGDQSQAQAQAGTERRELDLGFLRVATQRQQVKQRQAEQQQGAGHQAVLGRYQRGIFFQRRGGRHHQADRHDQAHPDAELRLRLPQRVEAVAQHRAAGDAQKSCCCASSVGCSFQIQ